MTVSCVTTHPAAAATSQCTPELTADPGGKKDSGVGADKDRLQTDGLSVTCAVSFP